MKLRKLFCDACLSMSLLAVASLAHATDAPAPNAPGETVQILRGTRDSGADEQQPAALAAPWMSDVVSATPQQPQQVDARTATKTVPATPPANLPRAKHDSLIAAVKAGDFKDTETHILSGADLDAPDDEGMTAVYAAAAAGHVLILELLLDYGANPMPASPELQLRPIRAAASNANWECVRLLAEFGVPYRLSDAAHHGDLDSVKRMLQAEPELLSEQHNVLRDNPLHSAATGNQAEIIEYLVGQGASLSTPNTDGDTPLAYAVRMNRPEAVKALAAVGANMNHGMRNGDTVLHQKARNNDTETVDLVLSLGGNVNAQDDNGASPLHTAAENNHPGMIAFLLEHGAHIEASDNNGGKPLHTAASRGALQSVRTLIEHGALIEATDDDGATPVHAAAEHASKNAILALVQHGAELRALNRRQATAQHYVIEGAGRRAPGQDHMAGVTPDIRARIGLVGFFAENGLSAGVSDLTGMTPLHLAAGAGQRILCSVLLDLGARVNAQDSTGRTPLICALERSFTATAETLLDAGADPAIADSLGRTPLHAASQTGNRHLLRRLLDSGVDINAADGNGRTPLHYVAEKGSADLLRLLLAFGAAIDSSDVAGRQPLHLAVQRADPDPAKVLVGNGGDVSAKDMGGRQPLHVAASEGRADVVQLLLREGADPNGVDSGGYSPLHVAVEFGHAETARLLMAYQANPRAQARDGRTPAQVAEATNNRPLMGILRTSGGSPMFEDALERGDPNELERLVSLNRSLVNSRREGLTALHRASRAGNKELVEVFLGYGANATMAQIGGDLATPLHAAAETGSLDITQLLLMMGANPLAQDGNKMTPEDVARQNGHIAVAEAIRKRAEKAEDSADSSGRPERTTTLISLIASGETEKVRRLLDEYEEVVSARLLSLAPVQLATTTGKSEVLALLLARGANPNTLANPNTGRTLLHEAAGRGFSQCVNLLLEAGAKTDVKDRAGKTPAELALEHNFDGIAQMLRETIAQETE